MSLGIYRETQNATLPWQNKDRMPITKSIAIDSRHRDCTRYKNPSVYNINLDHIFRNVTGIELKGAIFPKTSYNIHTSNNKIDFAIGDFVTGFSILDRGSGYTIPPTVTISSPPGAGITASALAIIDVHGTIQSLMLLNGGSGYTPSNPPFVMISLPTNAKQARPAKINAIVGNLYTATLRVGEYEIGGNPTQPPSVPSVPSGLLLEIQNAMNYVVNGGAYNPLSTSPFAVRLVSQYPMLGAQPGTPEAYDTNACRFNRIQTINTLSSVWEILWWSGPNSTLSSSCVMGFNTIDTGIGRPTAAIMSGGDVLIPGGTAIRATFDYNLKNDPDYVIMSISINNKNIDRLKSPEESLDETFAVLFFDNNNPETLHDLSASPLGSIISSGGVQYLEGPTGKGLFWRDSGGVKPIKGYDFDSKKIIFSPPIASVSNMGIKFTKFGRKNGGPPVIYNMDGREHTLLFEFTANDHKTRMNE